MHHESDHESVLCCWRATRWLEWPPRQLVCPSAVNLLPSLSVTSVGTEQMQRVSGGALSLPFPGADLLRRMPMPQRAWAGGRALTREVNAIYAGRTAAVAAAARKRKRKREERLLAWALLGGRWPCCGGQTDRGGGEAEGGWGSGALIGQLRVQAWHDIVSATSWAAEERACADREERGEVRVRIPTSARVCGAATRYGGMRRCGCGCGCEGADACCFRCALLPTAAQQLAMQ